MFDQLTKDFAELRADFQAGKYTDAVRKSADLMEDAAQLIRRGADTADVILGPFKLGAADAAGDPAALLAEVDALELAVRPHVAARQGPGDPPADPTTQISPMEVITIISALIALYRKLRSIFQK